jgi:hypothetical protein
VVLFDLENDQARRALTDEGGKRRRLGRNPAKGGSCGGRRRSVLILHLGE